MYGTYFTSTQNSYWNCWILLQKNYSNHCSNRGPCYTEFMVHEAVLRCIQILSKFLFSVISQWEKKPLGSNLPCPHGCNKSGLCDRWIWGDVSTVGLLVHEPPAWKPPWLGSPPWRGQCQWNLHAGPHWRSLKTDREKMNKFYFSNFKHD